MATAKEPPEGVHHYETAEDVPWEISKYWHQRHNIFSKYDDGIWMTHDAWFGVTPEPVAKYVLHPTSPLLRPPKPFLLTPSQARGATPSPLPSPAAGSRSLLSRRTVVLACAKHNAEVYGVAKKIFWICGDAFTEIPKRLKQVGKSAVVFGSPPWGGPTYTDYEVFDLNVMGPYTLPFLYNSFSAITPDVVLYLPRTSDMRQLAKHAKPGEKLKVTHYCMHGASKALCVYFGSLAAT
ncbi:putative diacylglycerol O-acyltransferase tgs1 [Friedmanniomyces endolithicus]|nr:putative diacylglycerol O-acyltransferase tgs1 [Friedmanniomyces endolithicus]